MNPFAHIFGRQSARKQPETEALEETFRERVETDEALRSVDPVQVPADLQLRLRVALSHERVRAERRWFGRAAHRFHLLKENTLRPFAVQAAIACAALAMVVGIGVTLGAVTPQQAVEANDIPLLGFSAPRYLYTLGTAPRDVASTDQAPLMVEANISSTGRVYGYHVLSGALDPATDAALRERMLASVFKPANFFGEPVRGSIVLTFADVEVHG